MSEAPGDPPPEVIAEVESRKAALKRQKLEEIMAARDGPFADAPEKPAPGPPPPRRPPPRAESAGRCPDCGKPYGKIRRCFVCKPTKPFAPRPTATRPPVKPVAVAHPAPRVAAVPAVVAPSPPAAAVVRALRQVVELLAELTETEARWVVDSAYLLSRAAHPSEEPR
jgi:hypothetical protein